MKKIENGKLNKSNIDQKVELYGWIAKKRNLGGMLFIDLRDRSGIVQLLIKPESDFFDVLSSLKTESVIKVNGIVTERQSKNSNMATGDIEIIVNELEVLNEALDTPFEVTEDTTALEDTRLKYRYLDLRRTSLTNNFVVRHNITQITRNYFSDLGFLEIETPILCKSTPEGARDYLVPSRVNKGRFYALPQSPQIFKQLLMVSGFEKYFQIAKCFRDEDLRADRQPEFTQIDVEMSFIKHEDIMNVIEGLMVKLFNDIKGVKLNAPFKQMSYKEAMEDYGSDKPDLRMNMKLQNLTELFKDTEFSIFKKVIDEQGIINCLVVENNADKYSRKELDNLGEYIKTYNANSLFYLKYSNNELSGSISKNMTLEESNELVTKLNLKENDLVLIVADTYKTVKAALGALRLKVGNDLNLINKDTYEVLWVYDFPMFEYDESDKRYYAIHHPFTSPKKDDFDKLNTNPSECLSDAYDIVINGYEVGGGSIRIHQSNIQNQVFDILGFNKEEIEEKFGFLVNAFKYGTPPHGGLALGLDRLTMLLCGTDNIRDVIAFPKTASATDLMSESPNIVDDKQLEELAITTK